MSLLLAALSGCSWMSEPTIPPEVVERLDAMALEIHDLQDRVTELEAARAVAAEELPDELDAYVSQRELDERLAACVTRPLLDEELDALAERLAAAHTRTDAELDALIDDLVSLDDLAAELAGYLPRREVEALLLPYATLQDVARVTEDMATRNWVQGEVVDPLEARMSNNYNLGRGEGGAAAP